MKRFSVVGMGPGSEDYLLPVAAREIAKADVLIGAERFVERYPEKRRIVIDGPIPPVLESIDRERQSSRVAVLVSGDPGLFSLQRAIARRFKAREYVVVPGLSSFQLACARARVTWEDALIVSVHGRDMTALDKIEPEKPAVIFTDKEHGPQRVAAVLAAGRNGNRRCVVVENAGGEGEWVVDVKLKTVAAMSFKGLCVMVLP